MIHVVLFCQFVYNNKVMAVPIQRTREPKGKIAPDMAELGVPVRLDEVGPAVKVGVVVGVVVAVVVVVMLSGMFMTLAVKVELAVCDMFCLWLLFVKKRIYVFVCALMSKE